MNCLRCAKPEYCSELCKDHFIKYFYKKFKAHLARIKILKRSEEVNLKGKNKKLAEHLLLSLGDSLDVKFSARGKEVRTHSMDYKVVNQLEGLMTLMKPIIPSVLECYRLTEIEKFCELKRYEFEAEDYSKLSLRIMKEMDKLEIRKPNIYTSSYKILEKFYEALSKKI